MNDDMITLRELRKAHGYSLRKVAICAGLSASELSRVEVGERGCRVQHAAGQPVQHHRYRIPS